MEGHHWAGGLFFLIIIIVLIYLLLGSGVSSDNLGCTTIKAKCMVSCDEPYTVHNVALDNTCDRPGMLCCMKSMS